MLLSELIRQRRKELGLSQVQLAIRSDLYQRTVSDLERGMVKRPNLKTLQALARGLDMPMSKLALAAGQADSEEDAERLAEELQDADGDPVLTALLWELREMDEGGKRMVLDQAKLVRKWQEGIERKLGE